MTDRRFEDLDQLTICTASSQTWKISRHLSVRRRKQALLCFRRNDISFYMLHSIICLSLTFIFSCSSTDWVSMSAGEPPMKVEFSMVYDVFHKQTIAFGGRDAKRFIGRSYAHPDVQNILSRFPYKIAPDDQDRVAVEIKGAQSASPRSRRRSSSTSG